MQSDEAAMKCDECHETIVGTYFNMKGKNICERDYEAKYRKRCSICGEGISGSYYTDKDGAIICSKDYKAQQGGSLDCKHCGREVSGEIVRALDSLFHPECFSCCECGKNLASKETPFIADSNKRIYCREDYNRKYAPKCFGCGDPIAPKLGEKTAPRLRAMERDWHPQCFKCADCQDLLGGGDKGKKCYPLDEQPLCMECHKKRLI